MSILKHYANLQMKKYELTTGQVLIAEKGFEIFGGSEKPGHVGLNAALINNNCETIGKAFRKEVATLFERFGLKRAVDKDGVQTSEFVPADDERTGKPKQGSKQIAPEHLVEYQAEIDKMEAVVVKFEAPELAAEDIHKLNVPPNVLKAILPFITFAGSKAVTEK